MNSAIHAKRRITPSVFITPGRFDAGPCSEYRILNYVNNLIFILNFVQRIKPPLFTNFPPIPAGLCANPGRRRKSLPSGAGRGGWPVLSNGIRHAYLERTIAMW
jgi:hypothetical protein